MGSGSTSSIYGNRNVISGLASGMDTEAMIENSIAGYKNKIMALQKKQVKTEWQQDAYRSIISKMVGLTQKYTSYTSGTNLFSNSFFNRAVTSTAHGSNASKVSATGKSSNNISIESVSSVAKAARYSTGAQQLVDNASRTEAMDWSENGVTESTIAGTINMKYGNNSLSLRFGENDIFESTQDLVDEINKQLADQTIKTNSGSGKASDYLEAKTYGDGRIVFEQKKAQNKFYFESASENIEKTMGLETGEDSPTVLFAPDKQLTQKTSLVEHMKDRTMSFTLDGVTKTISLGPKGENDTEYQEFAKLASDPNIGDKKKAETFSQFLQKRVDEAFGKDRISIGERKVADADGKVSYALDIKAYEGNNDQNHTLTVTSSASRALGLGNTGIGNTMNTSWTLGDVMADDYFAKRNEDGSIAKDESGKTIYEKKDLVINGKTIGTFDKDTTLESVLTSINNNADAGVNVSFSKLTNEFVFTSRETGSHKEITMDSDFAKALFGDASKAGTAENPTAKYEKGEDTVFTANINGSSKTFTRSTNVVDLDGLSVTFKETFDSKAVDGGDAVTFTTATDTDTIVDAIKSFVEDYNAMASEIHSAYSTLPYQKSSGSFANYEPLVGDETDGYSESELKRYEEKAKQGILFGDRDLSTLYRDLTSAIQSSGVDGATLRSIGIETSYADGMTTLKLNETKLREALSADPDKVRDAFTKTKENGASSNGLMYNLKNTMDRYASTSIANPGTLVKKAGTPLSSYSLQSNVLQDQIDSLETQIEKWQDKMSDRIDYYTNQFTRLEQLINQMNSQSSALAGLMGG